MKSESKDESDREAPKYSNIHMNYMTMTVPVSTGKFTIFEDIFKMLVKRLQNKLELYFVM